MARRVEKNGGKALNYFLIPKAYNMSDDKYDYHVVPLLFSRLSLPRENTKSRRSSASSNDSRESDKKIYPMPR